MSLLPDGISRLRKFNTLMVALVTGCLLGQRFYQTTPEVVAVLEKMSTVFGVLLAGGVIAQIVKNRRSE